MKKNTHLGKTYFSLICLIPLLLLLIGCNPVNSPLPPNIIIINIDDLGWKDLGFMGSDFHNTPNINYLASQSRVFPNAYSAASNCAPSRASLFTGLWPNRHKILTVGKSDRGKTGDRKLIPIINETILSDTFPTIVNYLKEKGYATCHSGKWHLSEDPLSRGYDINIGGGHNGHPKSYYPPFGNVSLNAKDSVRLTDEIMTQTIKFLNNNELPFFINYAPYAVHTPIQGIDSLNYKYKNKTSNSVFSNIDYATMVENLDANIGRLLTTLKKLNLLQNTVIILTSDNGGLYGITDQHPLRAGKGSYYEGGIRVPFLVYWNEKIETGISNALISNMDIFPTIIDIVDPSDQIHLDGLSLKDLLLEQKPLPERSLYWHFPIYLQAYNKNQNQNRDPLFRTRPGSLVRNGDWKLHFFYEDNVAELYNLKDDISEAKDLSADNPAKLEEMLNDLRRWLDKTNAPIPKEINPDYLSN